MKHTEWLGEPGSVDFYFKAGHAAKFIAAANGWRGAFHCSHWWEAMDAAVECADNMQLASTAFKWAEAVRKEHRP